MKFLCVEPSMLGKSVGVGIARSCAGACVGNLAVAGSVEDLPSWCLSETNVLAERDHAALVQRFSAALVFEVDGRSFASWLPTAPEHISLVVLTLPAANRDAAVRLIDGELLWASDYDGMGGILAMLSRVSQVSDEGRLVPLLECGNALLSPNVRRLQEYHQRHALFIADAPDDAKAQVGDIAVGFVFADEPYDLWVPGAERKVRVPGGSRVLVVAPLGQRESSTHSNGIVPPDGLGIRRGGPLVNWIAAGGLIGILEGAAGSCANPLAQPSRSFVPVGVLVDEVGNRITTRTLALTPISSTLSTPVIVIAGTSAEAGKSTYSAKLITALTKGDESAGRRPLRVGAVKATGTGGIQDSLQHRGAGAVVAFDQVDAGIPSTYVDAAAYQQIALVPFLLCQDAEVDVIVAEMGGDVMWANNETLLRDHRILPAIQVIFVIANDSFAALGVDMWLKAVLNPTDARKVHQVCCPFRNHAGAVKRAAKLGLPQPLDPNDTPAAASVVASVVKATRIA
jgi:hypothetical protein